MNHNTVMNMKTFFKQLGLLTIPVIFFSISSVSGEDAVKEDTPDPFERPLIHSIINDDIRTIMQDLDRLMMKRNMSSLMIMEMQVEHLQKLVLNADRLAYAAQEMSEAIPGVRMTTESRTTFQAIAKQLVDEAENLRFLADDMQLHELEPAYQKIHSTCAACHLLFRDDS